MKQRVCIKCGYSTKKLECPICGGKGFKIKEIKYDKSIERELEHTEETLGCMDRF